MESLVVMLQSAGYDCAIPSHSLKQELRALGCDTVLDIANLVRGMGYEEPMELPEAGPADMARSDVLYVDVKAHRNGPKVWKRWPHLKTRTLWNRINGAAPEHVVNARGDHGNEIEPPCPVLTANLWYAEEGPWSPIAYACWPPFVRMHEYAYPRTPKPFTNPLCLIHNVQGWGYQALVPEMRKLGVMCHGAGSPDGLINHREIPILLSRALCMVHLKSNDAPGYALYEALAASCPVVCTRRLIWRCQMQSLLIPGETCLVFDRETHDSLSEQDVAECTMEVQGHLERLADRDENQRIGEAGRKRLQEVMWDEKRDGGGFRKWMKRMFP